MEIELLKTQIDHTELQENKPFFNKCIKGKSIYHYTSISGLQGILSEKKLRFTNIEYMNDKDEIIAGLDSMVKSLEIPEELRQEVFFNIIKRGRQKFVCCFSLDEDSLPMWNYYTKEINNQGYNIEFNNKKLVESILLSNPMLDGCDISFGNVDYSKDNNSKYSRNAKGALDLSIEIWLLELILGIIGVIDKNGSTEDMKKEIDNLKKKQRQYKLPIYSFCGEEGEFGTNISPDDLLCFIKRNYFSHEKEFRIIITVPDELIPRLKEKGIYKFFARNGILVPYIELGFSENVIKSIMISPTMQSDLVEHSIQEFMEYHKYGIEDFSKFIKHSKIPVRF